MTSVLRLEEIAKSFADERGTRQLVLSGISLNVEAGEIVWLRGESGSGKSTILNISGLLSTPDAGKVWINGDDRTNASSRTASLVRSSQIGMVFQSSNLLPELTALENVLLASRQPMTRATITAQLDRFGLAAVANRQAKRLSGGQQQRVAFCRALINQPSLLLADEPSSGLDATNTEAILDAMRTGAAGGCGVLVASHDEGFQRVAHRQLPMKELLIEQK
ncbi:ATP-binding cassette domain-containing protein [Arthrobacter sp. efr-133-R2A-120]|uniref:ABC transporter ATP-binding protein n=1 Tax=Arthrobacter sp. efr-133-R2A-120 TaxID=3040277 RepID=UPI00254B9DA2|nr:ATP-binding cassette domain-containing protein [Arthrobacter sp. efr-133-R2A-120]